MHLLLSAITDKILGKPYIWLTGQKLCSCERCMKTKEKNYPGSFCSCCSLLQFLLNIKSNKVYIYFFLKINLQSCRILFTFKNLLCLSLLLFSCPFLFISKTHKFIFIKPLFILLHTSIKGVTEWQVFLISICKIFNE